MLSSGSRLSVAVTLLGGLATVFALAFPGGIGGRDAVVRLTRGGLQRIGCPDTSALGHDDPESHVGSSAEPQPDPERFDGTPVLALVAASILVPVPQWRTIVSLRQPPLARPAIRPGHVVAGRAPPAL